MKTKKLFFAVLIMLCISQLATAQVTFQKTYGRSSYDAANYVQQTSDGGYFMAGLSADPVTNYMKILLIRTNAGGDTLWTKTYGGVSNDYINSAQQTTDGGFIIAGNTTSFGAGNGDIYLIKTDVNGDIVWTKTYGGTNIDNGFNVQQTADGGYIVAGNTTSFGAGAYDIFLVKTATNGDLVWSKTYGGVGMDFANYVQQTSDGGYIITGQTNSTGAGATDVFLIKTAANGDTSWVKTYGGAMLDVGYSVQQTIEGGYIITGYTQSFGAGSYDVYLIKTNATGDILWTKAYGTNGTDVAISGQQTGDGGYIITGQTNCCGTGDYDNYVVKTTADGDTLWTKAYGGPNDGVDGPNDEWGYSIMQTSDGGYIIGGGTHSFGSDSTDFYLVKTDNLGNSGCFQKNTLTIVSNTTTQMSGWAAVVNTAATIANTTATTTGKGLTVHSVCTTYGINETQTTNSFTLYPNPATSNFTLELSSGFTTAKVQIFNGLGALVYEQAISQLSTNINLSAPAGIYIVKVSDREKIVTQKLIVENK